MTHVFDLGHEDIDGLVGLNFVQPRTFTMFMVGANRMPDNTIGMILGPSGSGPNNQLRRDSRTTALLVGTAELARVSVERLTPAAPRPAK